MSVLAWLIGIPIALVCGAWLVAWLDACCLRVAAGAPMTGTAALPLRWMATTVRRQSLTTEAPDDLNRYVAPLLYLALAILALALVPVDKNVVLLQTPVGIVVWGAAESLMIIAVFLHGWSQNSLFPLIGGYRFVALGLCAMLLSMFVLIGTALPAGSLSLPEIVEAQRGVWNVVRQPLGLPLFMLLGQAVALREPMNFADSADLAGGTAVEDSGILHAAWQLARATMLVAFSTVAASAFLGGYLGPWLPGPVWLAGKSALLLALLVAMSHLLARPDASRALALLWTVLLPLAFLDLAIAGLGSLP